MNLENSQFRRKKATAKQNSQILTQVALVAIMGGGYPSSEAMWPFGSEFNFDCGKVGDHTWLLIYRPSSTTIAAAWIIHIFITSLVHIHQCCMGDSLECGGSAEQAVNLIPSETRTIFLGFEVQ